MKLIPPGEGDSDCLQRWLDMCQGWVVTIRMNGAPACEAMDVVLWNFCETDDDGYLCINVADHIEDDVTDDRTNRRKIRTIDISTLEVC